MLRSSVLPTSETAVIDCELGKQAFTKFAQKSSHILASDRGVLPLGGGTSAVATFPRAPVVH